MRLKALIHRLAADRGVQGDVPDLGAYLDKFIQDVLMKSETLQKAFDVSNGEMEEVYGEAFCFYNEDDYLESSTAFRWLVLLNPFVAKYWAGLAASLQLMGKYEKALHAYAMEALLDSDNPYPHFHAYECYCGLHQLDEGNKALKLAYTRTLNKEAYQALKQEIENIGTSKCFV
jgi:type III secretion system low calcium response chaperone LcrH/SycD